MKTTNTILLLVSTLAAASVAQARDIGPAEAVKLLQSGEVKAYDALEAAALSRHPGATLQGSELEQNNGRYVYQVELRDAQGVEHDVRLDAVTGDLISDRQDD